MAEFTRIHLTGAAGSGTSTLGRALAARASLRHFESDDYLWERTEPPYQRLRPAEERARLLLADLSGTSDWVLSGSLASWGDAIIPRFQLVVLVLAPTELRLARLQQRELERFGPEALAPGGVMHQEHRDFLEWAARYDDGDETVRSRRLHETWLATLPCRTVRVDGSQAVDVLVRELSTALTL